MTFVYFAYGSNMLPARLQARCPSARVIARATAAGYALEFSKVGKDGSAKATVVPATGHQTPGVLFDIAMVDLAALDEAEGKGNGYARDDRFTVSVDGGTEPVVAVTYVATQIDRALLPFDWYLGLVLAGAQHNTLPRDHTAQLRKLPFLADANTARAGRRLALEALQAHGITDLTALLRGP